MKKNMKKILVIVMALLPSLSILAMNPSGFSIVPDSDDIPIVPPSDPTSRPCIMSVGDGGSADDGGLIDLGFGGVHPRSGGHQGEPIAIKGSTPRPRSVAETPYCYHLDGVVYIEADNTITYINASVTRYNDNQVWSNASKTNTLSFSASADAGTYLLEQALSDGRNYIGEYIIE